MLPALAAAVVLAAAAPADKVVVLLPLGQVDPAYVEATREAIASRLNVTIRVDSSRELPKDAFYKPRSRWRAEKLLAAIDQDPPAGAWKVVAITEGEISTTKGEIHDWGIVGLGNLGDRSCVVSTHIFKKWSRTRETLLRRVADSAVHELGHTLGLDHCETVGCVMRDAHGKAVLSADTSTGQYCGVCRKQLEPELLKEAPTTSARPEAR
jgi:archaemetzincin